MARIAGRSRLNMAPVLRSLLLMTLGIALLTANDAASKYLVQTYPVGQVIGLRQAATLLVLIPYVMYFSRWSALRVVDWPGQLGRGLLFIIGSVFIVWSLAELPLATAITMLFASPIFMVLLSAPLLGERIGRHRWIAVIGGFAGVLIILRPGAESFQWALLLPLAAAMINALRDVLTRRLSRTETSIAILFWSNITLRLAGGGLACGAVVPRRRHIQRQRAFPDHRGPAHRRSLGAGADPLHRAAVGGGHRFRRLGRTAGTVAVGGRRGDRRQQPLHDPRRAAALTAPHPLSRQGYRALIAVGWAHGYS
jgi:drug/metabolite transporter (DMT)-like permease